MKNRLSLITLFVIIFLNGASLTFASSLNVDIETPRSPYNRKDFYIGFVTLDTENRATNVECYVKTPATGVFNIYDSHNLIAGGSSGRCHLTSDEITNVGIYDLYVIAKAGSDTETSKMVSFVFDDVAPGTPTSYSREQNGCTSNIKFRTADDNGETSKVELYRSENASFNADAGSRIAQQGIGSNQDGTFSTGKPDCTKNYFYAIRAFDGSGNGSGVIGDPNTIIQIHSNTDGSFSGALAVDTAGSQVNQQGLQGSVLGDEAVNGEQDSGDEEESVLQTPEFSTEDGKEQESTEKSGIFRSIWNLISGIFSSIWSFIVGPFD